MPIRSMALIAALLLGWPRPSGAQIRQCPDLAAEIAAGLLKRNVTAFTLFIVVAGDEADRRVIGSCQGGTRRIVLEPKGSGTIVPEPPRPTAPRATAPKPAAPAPAPAPAAPAPAPAPAAAPPASAPAPAPASAPTPRPANVSPRPSAPTTPPLAAPTARDVPAKLPPAGPAAPLTVRAVDPSAAPRSLSRTQLASLRKLMVDEGADDRDTLEEFVTNLKISGLPDLTSKIDPSRDFVLVESAQRNALSAFTMITSNGAVILAERSAWLIGLLPEQHGGLHDVCLLVRDTPAPGANYSDWTAEFNGTRYVKKTRQFKSQSCLDRVKLKIAR